MAVKYLSNKFKDLQVGITNYSDIDISIFLKNNLIENLDLLREVFREIEVFNKKKNCKMKLKKRIFIQQLLN